MKTKTRKPKVAIHNLGCAKNQVDGERILARLAGSGLEPTQDLAQAQIIIINTCAFVEDAKQETIREILRLAQYKKRACRLLVATGCFSQRYGREAASKMPEVDAFVGLEEAGRIEEIVSRLISAPLAKPVCDDRVLLNPAHRAFIKISDGCDNRCAYCAIPAIRGSYREVPQRRLIHEAQALQEQGVRELILIGQDTTLYGAGHGKPGLTGLLRSLLRHTDIPWLRVLYTHPVHWNPRLIELMASQSRICPYIDMPVQHLSNLVLARMGRKVTSQQIRDLVTQFRTTIPDVTIRTTVLVGFPGETPDDYSALLHGIEEIRFDRLGVFAYSREEGTPAYRFPRQVPRSTAQARLRGVVLSQRGISRAFNRGRIGKILTVMLEKPSAKKKFAWIGRTAADAPDVDGVVYLHGPSSLHAGDFVKARIDHADLYDLYGTVLPA